MPFHNRLGALCWTLAAPLFLIANVVVGLRWTDPAFSWATNNVSDLGNVSCGVWDTTRPRYVCSPWHDAMNVAFVLTGILLVAGFALTWRHTAGGKAGSWGKALMLLGGAGLGLAGAFPADVDENLHLLAALLVIVFGNIGLLVAGFARTGTPLARLRWVTLGLGVLGTAGSVLFFAQQGVGIGVGGMERVAVFPLSVWACYAGLHLLAGVYRSRGSRKSLRLDDGMGGAAAAPSESGRR
ncbi:DUF998 domain-containing protein [Actinoplanes missouriensis]|uniref:DUF998 domain-containing protein n=1 Tax=Actinoplanes missouriensis TaxID=1866 RepID=UPI0033D5B54A